MLNSQFSHSFKAEREQNVERKGDISILMLETEKENESRLAVSSDDLSHDHPMVNRHTHHPKI